MNSSDIQIGKTYALRVRRHTVIVRVASRVLVRGDWWNCIEEGTQNSRLAHTSEFLGLYYDDEPENEIAEADAESEEEAEAPAVPRRPQPRTRRRSRLATAVTILAIMPPAYVLSVGPAYGMQRREAISESTFDKFYWPLLKLANRSESVQSLLDRYSEWWV